VPIFFDGKNIATVKVNDEALKKGVLDSKASTASVGILDYRVAL
jgi:hypothetical protein